MLKFRFLLWIGVVAFSLNLATAQSFNEKLAREYMQSGAFEKAQKLYEDLYDKAPNQDNYQLLFECYMAQDDSKSAEKLIRKQLKQFNNAVHYQVDLADFYEKQGKKKAADKVYESLIDEVKENPHRVIGTANALVKKQKLQAAIEVYKIGMGHKPSPSYLIQMGEIYAQLQDQEAFFETYLQLIEMNPSYMATAKNRFTRATTDDPENESNIILRNLLLDRLQKSANQQFSDLLSWLFIQEKNFETAFIQLKALDKRNNGNQESLYQLAAIARKNMTYEVAISCYDYILEQGKDGPYYLLSRKAILKTNMEMLTQAKVDEKDLISLDQKYSSTLEELGFNKQTIDIILDWAYLKGFYLNQTEEGIALLFEALEIPQLSKVDKAKAKMQLGDILLFQNNIWDAVVYFGQAEKSFAEDILGQEAKYRKARVYYFTGDFGWAQGQLDILKGSTSKLIANDAMKLSLLINDNMALDTTTEALKIYARADLWLYQKQYNQALQTLDSLINNYSGHPLIDEAHYQKARIYSQLGNREAAIKAYQTIIDQYGFDLLGDDALYFQATLWEANGQMENAANNYEKLIREFPGSTFTATARKRFRQLRGDNIN